MTKKHVPMMKHLDELLSETLVHLNRLDSPSSRGASLRFERDELFENRRLLEQVDDDVINMEREIFSEASALVARMLQGRGMVISSSDVDQVLTGAREQINELREQLENDVKDSLREFYAGVASLAIDALDD